jgi:hypothetical protein
MGIIQNDTFGWDWPDHRSGIRDHIDATMRFWLFELRVPAVLYNPSILLSHSELPNVCSEVSEVKSHEMCDLCGEPTGRAGAGDDSIYRECRKQSDELFRDGQCVCGDDMVTGPLCEDCNSEMTKLGFFED